MKAAKQSEKMQQVEQKESDKAVQTIYLEEKANIWLIYYFYMNENTFVDSFFFCLYLFLSHCYFLLSAFYLLSHFKIIRCIEKSPTGTSTYFLLKYNWKKENLKGAFWVPGLGAQTSIPVSQTAWIHHCEQVNIFNKTIINIFSNFTSNKLVTFDDKDPPWMTEKF